MTAFDDAFTHTVGLEGDFSNHVSDSGGATRFGITERVARANGYSGDMRVLPFDMARKIYRRQYWDAIRLDDVARISPRIAAEIFDTGVNMGVGRATQLLQRALNVLNKRGTLYRDMQVDGAMGPVTIAALRAFINDRGADGETVMLRALNGQQAVKYIEFAENNQSQESFVYGWLLQRVS